VREHDLEADQEHRRESGELERRLPPRDEDDGERADDQQRLKHFLQNVQVRQARGCARLAATHNEIANGCVHPSLIAEPNGNGNGNGRVGDDARSVGAIATPPRLPW
jgi:hypothetical protein